MSVAARTRQLVVRNIQIGDSKKTAIIPERQRARQLVAGQRNVVDATVLRQPRCIQSPLRREAAHRTHPVKLVVCIARLQPQGKNQAMHDESKLSVN